MKRILRAFAAIGGSRLKHTGGTCGGFISPNGVRHHIGGTTGVPPGHQFKGEGEEFPLLVEARLDEELKKLSYDLSEEYWKAVFAEGIIHPSVGTIETYANKGDRLLDLGEFQKYNRKNHVFSGKFRFSPVVPYMDRGLLANYRGLLRWEPHIQDPSYFFLGEKPKCPFYGFGTYLIEDAFILHFKSKSMRNINNPKGESYYDRAVMRWESNDDVKIVWYFPATKEGKEDYWKFRGSVTIRRREILQTVIDALGSDTSLADPKDWFKSQGK